MCLTKGVSRCEWDVCVPLHIPWDDVLFNPIRGEEITCMIFLSFSLCLCNRCLPLSPPSLTLNPLGWGVEPFLALPPTPQHFGDHEWRPPTERKPIMR